MTHAAPHRLTPATVALLLVPPLMWAANAVVGRLAAPWIPPVTLNWWRWALAALVLWPLARGVFSLSSPVWPAWRRFTLLGLLGMGSYNTLQYLALHTSTPMNVTLVAASTPLWMLVLGRLFFGAPLAPRALLGALFSLGGVLVVLSQGHWERLLLLRLVPGDGWMLLAAVVWAWYSWLLARPSEPPDIRNHWAAFLLAQVGFGLVWSSAMAAGEWAWLQQHPDGLLPTHIAWGWPLAGVLLFVALGPSVLAYRCWGAGVLRAGPTVASFFSNLTPLFAALLSALFLGDAPKAFHGVAFVLMVCGIGISTSRPPNRQ
jgi:drug/metabolite transporter (DMT)-like permease